MRFLSILAALALMVVAGVAHAGDKVLYRPAPAWVLNAPPIKPNTPDGDEDGPAFAIFDQQQRLGADGQVWAYMGLGIYLTSPEMLTQAGTVTLPWSPDKGDLIIHSAEIIRGTQRIDLLKSGQRFIVLRREQQLERAFLSGQLTATMSVEGLRVGDLLYMRYSVTQKDPVFQGKFQTLMPIMPEELRVGFGRVRLLWPSGVDLRWRTYVKDPVVQTADAGGYRELNVATPVPKQPEMPYDAPMRYRPLPVLEATNFDGWGAVVRNQMPLYRTEGTIKPGSPLAAEVAKIAAATKDPRERTAMALRLVQDEVRYLFRGMEDGNYVPQTPAFTWEARYGDCKAKTLILVAMLRALGVEADAALVSATMGDLVPKRLPMPGAFDHVIARAVIGGEVLWLDGTAIGARLADLGDVPPFRYALPLREGVTDLEPMPMSRSRSISAPASASPRPLPSPRSCAAPWRGWCGRRAARWGASRRTA